MIVLLTSPCCATAMQIDLENAQRKYLLTLRDPRDSAISNSHYVEGRREFNDTNEVGKPSPPSLSLSLSLSPPPPPPPACMHGLDRLSRTHRIFHLTFPRGPAISAESRIRDFLTAFRGRYSMSCRKAARSTSRRLLCSTTGKLRCRGGCIPPCLFGTESTPPPPPPPLLSTVHSAGSE